MRVLVACEFSGIVRDAFLARSHEAWSCDLLPSERSGPHIQGDVTAVLEDGWDLMVAHPPCTFLAVSGARWFAGRRQEQADALAFVRLLMDAPIPRIAIENPVSVISSQIRKPDQIIQPWQFGHGETKATCLWLKGLPLLTPTNIVPEREARVHLASPGPDRWKERSRTLPGIAAAMADQWGSALNTQPEPAQECEFVPAHEPWECRIHRGVRTRLDEPQCDIARPAEPFNDAYLDNIRQGIAEGRNPGSRYNVRRLLATIDQERQATAAALDFVSKRPDTPA